MKEEFSLSKKGIFEERIKSFNDSHKRVFYSKRDVKEFIKKLEELEILILKRKITIEEFWIRKDKLAGKDLI